MIASRRLLSLPSTAQPRRSRSRLHNLPTPPTPLLGRDTEVATGREILLRSEVRLLTLTGPAGVGKTRLAVAIAAELFDAFAQGGWFVDLVSLVNPDLLGPFIAQAIGVRAASDRVGFERLLHYLQGRQVLLVLDNFEHVLQAASALPELLAGCPGLKLLVTSREPLRLRCEHRFAVPPLALPDLTEIPDQETGEHAPALRLFLARARAANEGLCPTADDLRAIAELCVRLDGLPLAIELAAAHSDVLAPRAMLARLDQHLPLPRWNAVDLPARHRTLRAALDWSYDRLDEAERRTFRLLALFVGSFTADAVEAVHGEPADPFDVLTSLVDKSLVQVVPGLAPTGTVPFGPRFRLLETIRTYAREQLEENGELAVGQMRYAAFYLGLAEHAEALLKGPDQRDWDDRLEHEHANLRAALQWGLVAGGPDFLPRLAGALTRFWWDRGDLAEGRHWLEQALITGRTASAEARAKALGGAGLLAFLQGDLGEATHRLEESIALWRDRRRGPETAEGLAHLGLALALRGDVAQAETAFEEGLALAPAAEAAWTTAFILRNRGTVLLHQDQPTAAVLDLRWSRALFEHVGDARNAAIVLSQLAWAEWQVGEAVHAVASLRESLELARSLHDRRAITLAAGVGGWMTVDQGEPEGVARLLAGAEALREANGIRFSQGALATQARASATIETRLPPHVFARAWEVGSNLSPDQVAAEALVALDQLVAPVRRSISDEDSPSATSERPGGETALSEREREVLRLVAQGLSNKQIARTLHLSERTIKTYLTAAFNKLGVENRAEAAVLATRRGLV